MRWWKMLGALALAPALAASATVLAGGSPWPTYEDETATRLIVAPAVGTEDTQEKDYAWGDVDRDGDVDLIVVRKEPWNTTGRFRNLLLMNEGMVEGHPRDGILVDRTIDFAASADDGGSGMLDLTNDRDVVLVDLDGDDWLDVVTSTTYGEGLPKTISHPRVYRNLGEIAGVWQGFRYEQARTPTMPITPHFCGVGVGDVNGDGAPDLYFTDYNNDLEDRLWINDGNGHFADESEARMTFAMRESDFGVHAVIADVNQDGARDVVKDRGSTNVTPPLRVSIAYNATADAGTFDAFEIVYTGNPYHVEVGDLNGDGRLDLVIDDDGVDRYLLNQGNGADGRADFTSFTFPPPSDGFGGNIVIRDLNNDGHMDVVIADVDVDCCGCTRHMHFWRNVGDVPNVTFREETGGIPIGPRTGTHDVAVFDIDGDGWLDLVIGTCTGTSVWMAQPQIAFTYPDGPPPGIVTPDEPTTFRVAITGSAGADVAPGTAMIHAAVGGADPVVQGLEELGGSLYRATLPALACLETVRFHLTVETVQGATFDDPPAAPDEQYAAVAADGTEVTFQDDVEGDVSSWTLVNDPALVSGAWEQADPNGTVSLGELAAPDDDATPGAGNVLAFVTENGPPEGHEAANDVDGGPTELVSPRLDLADTDATVSYTRWFYCDNAGTSSADFLTVDVSNDDGASWIAVPEHTTGGTGGWERVSFVVGDLVTPTATVRVRLRTSDLPNDSVTEAGIDDFQVAECGVRACPEDVDGGGDVGFSDLLAVLSAWGPCTPCAEDVDGNGDVGFSDLLAILSAWGDCG